MGIVFALIVFGAMYVGLFGWALKDRIVCRDHPDYVRCGDTNKPD